LIPSFLIRKFKVERAERMALNRFFAIRDPEGNYLGTMEYLLNFSYIEQIAEKKKDAHVFKTTRRD